MKNSNRKHCYSIKGKKVTILILILFVKIENILIKTKFSKIKWVTGNKKNGAICPNHPILENPK